MMCFSLDWIMHLLILAVCVGAVVAVVKLLLPYVMGPLGEMGGLVLKILTIIFWAVILIMIIYFAFELLSCLFGGGGMSLRR